MTLSPRRRGHFGRIGTMSAKQRKPWRRLGVLLGALVAITACRDSAPKSEQRQPAPAAQEADDTSWKLTSAGRVIAFGDVHGDLAATRAVLTRAGVIDAQSDWVAGDAVVVQLGDQLDRGDGERAIIDLFERLQVQARAAGGRFVPLVGNHELMNVAFDFRYVTDGGWTDFADIDQPCLRPADQQRVAAAPQPHRGRIRAFCPGGPYAKALSDHRVIVQVDRSVFVHGGVLKRHLDYGVGRMNREVSSWLAGREAMPEFVAESQSPIWTRAYAGDSAEMCEELGAVLSRLSADRLVIGHTVQKDGVTSACGGRLWRVDVGMAEHYGGTAAAIVVEAGQVSVLEAKPTREAVPPAP